MTYVKFKRFNDQAKLPVKFHDSDFCFDVYATSKEEISPNVIKYGLGFGLEIVRDNYNYPDNFNVCFHLYPRSSIYKTGLMLSNSIGTIDEDYRNEISAIFYHVINTLPAYNVGDRIGQIVLSVAENCKFIPVDELTDTERGMGGYGSTGTK